MNLEAETDGRPCECLTSQKEQNGIGVYVDAGVPELAFLLGRLGAKDGAEAPNQESISTLSGWKCITAIFGAIPSTEAHHCDGEFCAVRAAPLFHGIIKVRAHSRKANTK